MPNVYLGDEFESFVKEKVRSGQYVSASEVLRDGLRLLQEREQFRQAKLDALRSAIEDGLASGDPSPFDAESVKRRARARFQETSPGI